MAIKLLIEELQKIQAVHGDKIRVCGKDGAYPSFVVETKVGTDEDTGDDWSETYVEIRFVR
jgi:hypothetical protein